MAMVSIHKKLIDVQKEVGTITKDTTNPFFKSQYFDINGLLAELKPVLTKHNLIVLQPLSTQEGKLSLRTKVIDADTGDIIEDNAILPENSDPQKMGAIITYFRRYALQSFFLLQAEDDDANSASQKPQNARKTKQTAEEVELAEKPLCHGCGEFITQAEKEYSLNKFKRQLCRKCQN